MVKVILLGYTRLNPELRDKVKDDILEGEFICALAAKSTVSSLDLDSMMKMSWENARKTVRKVVSYGHESVVEHLSFTFAVWDFSRIVSQQLTRHRIASFTQRGQRYVKLKEIDYITPPTKEENQDTKKLYDESIKKSFETYFKLLEKGIPAEDARFVLPNSVPTFLVFTMNARELLHFFRLRLCARAQWEIRELALKMLKLVYPIAPDIFSFAGAPCMIGEKCKEPKRPIESCRKMVKIVKELKEEYERNRRD